MQEIQQRYALQKDVQILAVHYDSNYGLFNSAQEFFENKGYTIPVVEDGTRIRRSYGVRKIPTLVLIDRNGAVAYTHTGVLTEASRDEVIARIEGLRTDGLHVNESGS